MTNVGIKISEEDIIKMKEYENANTLDTSHAEFLKEIQHDNKETKHE